MARSRYNCLLLTSDHAELASAAEAHAAACFDIRHASAHARNERGFPAAVRGLALSGSIDFLLNYLSPLIVPADVLAAIRRDSVNVHPAPPEWPGVGAASYALYANDATFGVTVHRMAVEVDSGEILKVVRFPIRPDDGCDTLWDRALETSLTVFRETCDQLARDGGMTPSGDRWARRATTRKEFERWMTISPAESPDEIARKVREMGHRRFPGPFVELAGFRFELPP